MLLIIVILGMYTKDVITLEFNTSRSCEQARQFIIESTNNDKDIKTNCVMK
jgi:hypothetical protein